MGMKQSKLIIYNYLRIWHSAMAPICFCNHFFKVSSTVLVSLLFLLLSQTLYLLIVRNIWNFAFNIIQLQEIWIGKTYHSLVPLVLLHCQYSTQQNWTSVTFSVLSMLLGWPPNLQAVWRCCIRFLTLIIASGSSLLIWLLSCSCQLYMLLHDWIFDYFLCLVIRIMLHFNAKAINITANSQLLNHIYHSLYFCLQINKTVHLFK